MITPSKKSVKLSGNTERRYFPRSVKYTTFGHNIIEFKAGLNGVPVEFLGDEWLKSCGMQEMPVNGPLPPMIQKAGPGSQAYATAVASSGVYDGTFVPRDHNELSIADQAVAARRDLEAMELSLEKQREYVDIVEKLAGEEATKNQSGGSGAPVRPEDGDVNPNTGKKFTKKELAAAQAEHDRLIAESNENSGNDGDGEGGEDDHRDDEE